MSTDPATVGARVLASLEAGRRRAIEAAQARAAPIRRAVRREFDIDVLDGRDGRGRAGRIARRLRRDGIRVSERHVKRILDMLSSVSDSSE